MARSSSLLHADPLLFSPISLNADRVATDKLFAFYRFANLFFPTAGTSSVNTIMNMERHGERLTANCSPQERKRLIGKMKNLSMDMRLTVSDEGQNVIDMSIHIVPSEVLGQARQGMDIALPRQSDSGNAFDTLIARLIAKEINRRCAAKVVDLLKPLAGIAQIPALISRLLGIGQSDCSEQLPQAASIADLLLDEFRERFGQAMPEELVQEGMAIRTAIATCIAMSQCDADSPISDATARRAQLEIAIREAKV